ncbi:MAG: filamentous hemagglutinin family protein [Prosthecobacter sp.]
MTHFGQPRLCRPSLFNVVLAHGLVLLLLLTPCTQAGDILRMGGGVGGAAPDPTSAPAANPGAIDTAAASAQARANAQDMLARNTMALQAVTAMQEAARAAAAGVNNAGANPNFPGQTLPNVPNGLGVGGLDLVSVAGALTPQQSQENARTIVTIQQQQQQAMLEWNTFNIGRETTVRFDQSAGGESAGSWIAFNRITDPSGNPTQILGSIEAQGQVYVINQNGIIFGGASVVNTHTLVASALPINDNLITRGLLNNPDAQFLFSANPQAAGTKGPTPAYTPPSPPASGRIGNVTVQAGARITAPTSAANVGGRVALIGPNVTNEGTISTPDGQTILAAGMEVGFDAHSTDDPSLRGLDVYVGDVGSYGGTATNAGLIEAPRGSIVITGKSVNQNGFIDSTTSAALNGRVDLLANYNAVPNINFDPTVPDFGRPFVYQSGRSSGIVATGAGSVIQILPEYSSVLKVVGTELALKSQINMQGLGVHLGMNSVILAPNADVALSAGVWDVLLSLGVTDQDFVHAAGQVYLDTGAVINVAGSTAVAATIDEYILEVTLRAAELADSALQRNGSLRGQTVTVDLRQHGVRADGSEWVGTPLANLTGYLGVIERNVGQLTVAGGSVSIKAGDSVVIQNGAEVNVSGGYKDFAAGNVETSRLVHEGNLVDIADARADILYEGIYTPNTSSTDPRWGSSTGSSAPFGSTGHHEDAHVAGADGGSIEIHAASMALDGSLKGGTVIGSQQLQAAPQHSTLSLYFQAQRLTRLPPELPFHSPTPPDIEFRNGPAGQPAAGAFALDGSGVPVALRQERRDSVILSPTLLGGQGFGNLRVDNLDGDIQVGAGVSLAAPLAGSVTLRGANVDIQGTVLAQAGTITLAAYNISPFATEIIRAQGQAGVIPAVNAGRGRVTIGSSALVSAAGVITDDRPASATQLLVPGQVARQNADGSVSHVTTTEGGSITIDAYTAELAANSVLDVSGGFAIDGKGHVSHADAGSLTLKAGRDPLLTSVVGGRLELAGILKGFSGAGGGNMTLLAPVIQVGGAAIHANALLLQPDFFNQGGFDSFHVGGLGINVAAPGGENFLPGVLITSGSDIRPQVRSLQVTVDPEGGPDSLLVETLLRPEGYRPPAALVFEAAGVDNFVSGTMDVRGQILMQAGSNIETDALGSVSFIGQTVELFGSVVAPGGSVTVSGAFHYRQNGSPSAGLATVHLGSTSLLSTAGKTVLLQNAYGLRTGHVHGGGTILVQGNVVADAGSVLDASGTTGILDLLPEQAGTGGVYAAGMTLASLFPGTGVTQPVREAMGIATQVESNGGHITLNGGDFLFSNATLVARAGGTTAAGGTLTVQSDRFILPGADNDDTDITLMVAQDMSMFGQPVFAAGQVLGSALATSTGTAIAGKGYFGINTFATGGFDSLVLGGNVQFTGPVNVTAAAGARVADGGVLAANDLVTITAPYVSLGRQIAAPMRDEELENPFRIVTAGSGDGPKYFGPTYGSGRLEVTADLIETGFLSLQSIGQASLTARHDLRGSGYFDMAGHLTITAGQVYPVTASTFTLTAYDYIVGGVTNQGSVTIASSGVTPEFPLSGGGRLNIFASTITQGGTLRAPLGSIRLGWDGNGTSVKGLVTNTNVPVSRQITLKDGSVTSVSAIDPQTGQGTRIPYGIIKDGTNWIDPTGFDITSIGAPDKSIRIGAANVTAESGSDIDIRGGGELYGYRWVEGNGGTNDILASTGSYAILPGYGAFFAPFASYATGGIFAGNLGGDLGYVNSGLSVGDSIFLKGAPGITEGVYTLLPARYALLPGAMLVTPDTSGTLAAAQVKPGGAVIASGYMFNGLNDSVSGRVYQQFEVAPQSVVKARADYQDFAANTFIPAAQQRLSLPVSFTSSDAGYILLSAMQTMQLNGGVSAAGFQSGRGGRVDLSSPLDIILGVPGAPAQAGKLVLDTALLSGWSAESLFIGGERVFGSTGATATVRTTNLTVDNAGAPLTGREIILAASGHLTLAPGAVIMQTGAQVAADVLSVTGNGTLVRVSGVAGAATSRTGVTSSSGPQLSIGAGVLLSGASVTMDSTSATVLDPAAVLSSQVVNLSSGRLSILLDNPGSLQAGAGMILGGTLLSNLRGAAALSLLSYSALDFYGSGTFAMASSSSLALHAGELRGFNNNGSTVAVTAGHLLLDNSGSGVSAGAVVPMSGTLDMRAGTITIGSNALVVSQFATVDLHAAAGLKMQGTGSFKVQGVLNVAAPFVSASSAAIQVLAAGGALNLTRSSVLLPTSLGLGAQVSFEGHTVSAATDIYLPAGFISMRALGGDLNVSGKLDAGGVGRQFFDAIRYADAGQVSLAADNGNVVLAAGSVVNLSAAAGGGDAGLLVVNAAGGATLGGELHAQAGLGGKTGSADMDVGFLGSFSALNDKLNAGFFAHERLLRVRTGSVTIDGTVNAHRFLLGLDDGSVTVTGTINASGVTGGRIDLIARGDVTLAGGSLLTVAGEKFDSAGKGGLIWLESGAQVNGTIGSGRVSVQAGSTLNLSVAAKNAGGVDSAARGQFSGVVHIRAPQNSTFNDMLVDPIAGTFVDPSAIEIEGYRLYDFSQANVVVRAGTTALSGEAINVASIHAHMQGFFGAGNASYNSMFSRLLGGNTSIQNVAVIQPGVEIINRGGTITLGSTISGSGADWDLASFRYGPKNAAGVLTLRAAGNLEFYNTLSDGFTLATAGNLPERMWMATLTTLNTSLPVNSQSWSYRLAAGSDFTAANFREVSRIEALGANAGSLLLGKDAGQAIPSSAGVNPSPGESALTRLAINPTNGNTLTTANRFQVIRTGTGNIDVVAGRDVQLLNQFATIYTAGAAVPNITTVFSANDFVRPIVSPSATIFPDQGSLGAVQQLYAAHYSMAGGNVSVSAQRDIAHYTRANGELVMDSSRQLPNNWLMRRGYVNAAGEYGATVVFGGGTRRINDTASSTTWWVDFSNFFDGVGALGGGNVTLQAGRDVQNVSAHAPTNARAARGMPTAAGLLEMGGGDVTVEAGRNIDGGIYYVERGTAELFARNEVTTNSTRSPSLGRLLGSSSNLVHAAETWLPTTFFVGRGSLDVSAGGNILMGPVANTMLLPQGLNNKHWYKTYFSTYSTDSSVQVSSLGGDITFRQAAVLPNVTVPASMLGVWMESALRLGSNSAAFYQPWLRLVETEINPFNQSLNTLMPGSLRAISFAGDVNLVGEAVLSPSPTGRLEILAAGSINGLMPAGISETIVPGQQVAAWTSSRINMSDASPSSIPGALSPFAYYQTYFDPVTPINNQLARLTSSSFLAALDLIFAESGSTTGNYASLQIKQGLHAQGVLHANDLEPVRLSAVAGDISGLELFSPKHAVILAGQDISDVSFYLQNVRTGDLSIVSSGRDIIAYNANSKLRTAAGQPGNQQATFELPKAGDIQISGPGTLEVLAGRDLNLGTGSNNSDGTGVGITSIGNGRNPSLPFAGADIIVAAGMGGMSPGLGGSNGKFETFIATLLNEINPPSGQQAPGVFDTRRYLGELARMLQKNGLRGLSLNILETDPLGPALTFAKGENVVIPDDPNGNPVEYPNSVDLNDPSLTAEQRNQLGLALYFIALKEAGRDRNDPASPDVNTYRAGYEAIQALFPVPAPANLSDEDLLAVAGQYLDEGNIVADPATLATRDPATQHGLAMLLNPTRPIPGYVFSGNILTQGRDIRTKSGGNISIMAPGGGLQLAATLIGETLAPPGIITESGGNISIFADQDVSIGIARIFTLRGGDINIWSTVGNIAAGSSSKTVQSAPPTRVLIDPQSANVATDLAGLATGGGIGVLATVAGVAPGNVDLIAPVGAVDAGDAGIRATGNLNIAANIVLNAANISVGGTSGGTPAAASVASPSLASVSGANSAAAASNSPAAQAAEQAKSQQPASQELPSIITVEVIGYGGGTGDDDEERKRNQPGE